MANNELFDQGTNPSNPSDNGNSGSFNLGALMSISARMHTSSELVGKTLELHKDISEKNPVNFPYKLTQLTPEWLGGKELLVLHLQHEDKLAITPILFGGEVVEDNIRDSNDKMIRSAGYPITRRQKPKTDEESSSPFLNYCVDDLQKAGVIKKVTSMSQKNVTLAGCLVVRPEMDLEANEILAVAISELRAGLWSIMGTGQASSQDNDLNHLNYSNTTCVVDLVAQPRVTDSLKNNVFSPLVVRISQYRKTALLGSEGSTLVPRVEVSGYLEHRPLTDKEQAAYVQQNRPAPFLIPIFVVTHIRNLNQEGVLTPTALLEALNGLKRFRGENLGMLIDQCAQYSTTIDQACTTYNWSQVGRLIALEAIKRNVPGVTTTDPVDPIILMTGQHNPTVIQKLRAYEGAFGDLEVMVDVPQSGESAKPLQSLFSNLNAWHERLTGRTNRANQSLGTGELIPGGTFTRVSEKAQETRDAREIFNAVGMIDKFHHGVSYGENFIAGMQHAKGARLGENTNQDRGFAARYKFLAETLIEDGSFKMTHEYQRVVLTNEYLDGLSADLESNKITYELRNSGAETISRLSVLSGTSNSLNFDNYYD